jgi:hypothetical protein
MAGTPSGTQLQRERAHLQRNLFTFPRESTVLPPGLAELVADPGPTSIRQLLTAMSTWRGPGAYLLPMGVWPHLRDTNAGMVFQLGPVASDRSPLLSDAQLLGLVCEGSPEPRPSIDEALRRLHLDVDDPAALQRARHAALIFAQWRLGADIESDTGRRGVCAVGASCRLLRYRAAMARLIAGVDDDLQRRRRLRRRRRRRRRWRRRRRQVLVAHPRRSP